MRRVLKFHFGEFKVLHGHPRLSWRAGKQHTTEPRITTTERD